MPNFVRDDSGANEIFDQLAMTYLLIELDRLNTLLKPSIQSVDQRRQIVTGYINGKVDLLDGYPFKDLEIDDCQWTPMLCFGRLIDPEEMQRDAIYIQPSICPLEEYIGGILQHYYDEFNETLPTTISIAQ